jgi:hypothetical protein
VSLTGAVIGSHVAGGISCCSERGGVLGLSETSVFYRAQETNSIFGVVSI